MITYNDLYEALRKERYNDQLQALNKSFISDVAEYFRDKKKIASKEQDLFSDSVLKTQKQFENAIGIFKELLLRRKRKILNLAFVAAETGISKRDFDNMLVFEREMFEKIMQNMENAEKSLNEMMNGKEEDKKNKLVIALQDIEEFLDLEGKSMGPFKKGQLINLPTEISKILEADKKVEAVSEE
jgi:DNA replication initiation complex subunit (GINS family)